MFGDDPDPTVMTERVGFGGFHTRTRGGLCAVQRNKAIACKWVVGLRTINEDKRSGNLSIETKRESATMNDCSFKNNDGNEYRCNADDAMMKCNKQIKHTATTK